MTRNICKKYYSPNYKRKTRTDADRVHSSIRARIGSIGRSATFGTDVRVLRMCGAELAESSRFEAVRTHGSRPLRAMVWTARWSLEDV